jgi:hypothetical protein
VGFLHLGVVFYSDLGHNNGMNRRFVMDNQWAGFDDFELACLCADYGYEDALDIASILPLKLANRVEIETLLTQHELDMAFGE